MNKLIALDLVDIIDEATTHIVIERFDLIKAGVVDASTISKKDIKGRVVNYLSRLNQYAFRKGITFIVINGGNPCVDLTVDIETLEFMPENSYWCVVDLKMRKALTERGISVPNSVNLSIIHEEIIKEVDNWKHLYSCYIYTNYDLSVINLKNMSPVDIDTGYIGDFIGEDPLIYRVVVNPETYYNETTGKKIIHNLTNKLSKIYRTHADSVINRIFN